MENTKANVLSLAAIVAVVMVMSTAEATVPAVFVLGDSTVDVGTNNFLSGSVDRADFPHNGIDFPGSKATGRFGNGLNIADFLAKQLGLEMSPPPFFMLGNGTFPLKNSSFKGVNFASGGAGILDITGSSPKNVVPLSEQTQQLSFVYNKILSVRKLKGTRDLFSKSLFFISIGSNDLFEHYHSKSKQPTDKFIASLVQAYGNHLRNLLKLGARKFGIVTVAPIGCCPSQRVFNHTLGCLEELNDLALAFHSQVTQLMYNLSFEYRDMKYSIGNAFLMTINVINNPNLGGFKDVTGACCGQGVLLNAQGPCTPTANLCPKRDDFLFWDSYHPTQKAAKLAAVTLYSGPPQFVAPINFKQLAEA
ncbi:GDSL esterase/lipase At5g55050 [Linum perenne]